MIFGGVDVLLPFVFPDGDGVVLPLGGYFDESMRSEGDEPICVGVRAPLRNQTSTPLGK